MTSGRQEDAHEFLSHLITAAVEDGNAVDAKKESDPLTGADRNRFSRDAEYLHALFDGSLCSSVRCRQCGTVSQTVEAMQGLELEVAHAGTLQAALEGFCRTEELDKNTDNAYDCSVCNEHTAAHKTLRLQKTPKLLRIQVSGLRNISHFPACHQFVYIFLFSDEKVRDNRSWEPVKRLSEIKPSGGLP